MPDTPAGDQKPPDTPSRWDAEEVLRARAAQAKDQRDNSVADLLDVMSDAEVLDVFGVDLSRLED
jgi:uncharacterized protein YjgD (DUF1641 family)